MTPTIEAVDHAKDHWWWRPGWREGRHYYACHVTLNQWPEVCDLVARYQNSLRDFSGVDLIPAPWLHLTMQGIGFVDQLSLAVIDNVASNLRARLATWPKTTVTFHKPVVRPEAIYLPAQPAKALVDLRSSVRSAIGDVLGQAWLESANGEQQAYRPHVSVAYFNASQPTAPIVQALTALDPPPATVHVKEVAVLEFHRDHRMYEWTTDEPIDLSTAD